ncbi:hypothetical protein BC831DRAFT_451019 [Entophlyctis helioformis]|nr:hypothetical protein BC831DRAFT_451019 [Entophlyctis helioformis]
MLGQTQLQVLQRQAAATELSDYEKQRLERIAEQQRFLRTLASTRCIKQDIPVPKRPAPARRPRSEPRARTSEPLVRRHSERLTGQTGKRYADDDEDDNQVKRKKKAYRRASTPIAGPLPDYVRSGSLTSNSCHHCRQKDDFPKVQCNSSRVVTNRRGEQSKIDCHELFHARCIMRYDQTMEEIVAIQAAGGVWSCPRCADSCLCSFCRRKAAGGILPPLYEGSRVYTLGPKSVLRKTYDVSDRQRRASEPMPASRGGAKRRSRRAGWNSDDNETESEQESEESGQDDQDEDAEDDQDAQDDNVADSGTKRRPKPMVVIPRKDASEE